MSTKIKIYAVDVHEAGRLAADLNLALRHWEYAGLSTFGSGLRWADVGAAMEELQETEWRYEQLCK